jgi:hypothetical protein
MSGKPDEDKPGKPHLYFAGNFTNKTSVAGTVYFVDIGLTISNQNNIEDTESYCL